MENVLTSRDLSIIKRVRQNVDSLFTKKVKLEAKIAELRSALEGIDFEIEEMEAPVIRRTGGKRSTDLFEKQVIPQFNDDGTPKVDKEGRQIKITKYTQIQEPEEVLTSPSWEDNTLSTIVDNEDIKEEVATSDDIFPNNLPNNSLGY